MLTKQQLGTPLVSVLLPVFNAQRTLDDSLLSIANQSLESFEVVAVDDGSTDNSADILRAWSVRDPRIRPIFSEHLGLIEAPNLGLMACRGNYIARMDADDRMHEKRLEKQIDVLYRRQNISVVSCLVNMFSEEGNVGEGMRVYQRWLNSLVSHSDIMRERFIESPIANPTAMMRREELQSLGGYQDCSWPEDYDLWLRYAEAGKRFVKVPEVLFSWREHAGRATHNDGRYSVENFLRAKAFYLARGPLSQSDGLILWGAGKNGKRLMKNLQRYGCNPDVIVDITPKKIGGYLRGSPIISSHDALNWWGKFSKPVLLVAVASRGARAKIRQQLKEWNLVEAKDYWCVA